MANVIDLSSLGLAEKLQADIIRIIYGQILTKGEEILRKHVMETVYSTSDPSMYRRTYDVLNAVEIANVNIGGGHATFDIWINPAKMSTIAPEEGAPYNGRWGSHVSFTNKDFREGLIEILDQGGGSMWYRHPAHGFMDKTFDEVSVEFVNILRDGLAAAGWDVS